MTQYHQLILLTILCIHHGRAIPMFTSYHSPSANRVVGSTFTSAPQSAFSGATAFGGPPQNTQYQPSYMDHRERQYSEYGTISPFSHNLPQMQVRVTLPQVDMTHDLQLMYENLVKYDRSKKEDPNEYVGQAIAYFKYILEAHRRPESYTRAITAYYNKPEGQRRNDMEILLKIRQKMNDWGEHRYGQWMPYWEQINHQEFDDLVFKSVQNRLHLQQLASFYTKNVEQIILSLENYLVALQASYFSEVTGPTKAEERITLLHLTCKELSTLLCMFKDAPHNFTIEEKLLKRLVTMILPNLLFSRCSQEYALQPRYEEFFARFSENYTHSIVLPELKDTRLYDGIRGAKDIVHNGAPSRNFVGGFDLMRPEQPSRMQSMKPPFSISPMASQQTTNSRAPSMWSPNY